MPYFITDQSNDCSGWAVVKEDGEVLGCHQDKQSAIDQMVAVSLAEDIEPGGERNKSGAPIAISDLDATLIWNGARDDRVSAYLQEFNAPIYIVTGRLEVDRQKTTDELEKLGIRYDKLIMNDTELNSVNYKTATAKTLLETFNVIVAIDDNRETLAAYRQLGINAIHPAAIGQQEARAVDLTPPQYMRDAARQGLDYYEAGYGGDGLVSRTINEARDMAAGRVTADKWVRIAAWIARHMVDLDATKNTDPADPEYPGAGLVAHLLWGSGNSKSKATRAMEYAQGIVAQLEAENGDRGVNLKQKETRMETRHFNGTINGLEIRADGDGRTFTGYAAVFNADSEPMGGFTERIAPGAFHRSLTSHGWDIKLLANHDAGRVLGSTRAKTLRLTEDDRGLWVEATLPDNTDGQNIAESIRRGDIDSMSFGFSITPGGDSWSKDGAIRTLTDVKLYEVSIVAWPAYTSTAGTTSVRALTAYAQRTDIDSDALKSAIDALAEVQELTTEQAAMLREIIDQLEMQQEQEDQIEDEIDMVEESAQPVIDEMPLDVLLNQIQLKLKGITNGN
jgi:HK97 family phage prohead protease